MASRRSVCLHQRQTIVRLACRGQRRRGSGHPGSAVARPPGGAQADAKTPEEARRHPATIVTDRLGSYRSALRELGLARRQDTGRWKNNRAENSHQPLRQRELYTMPKSSPTRVARLSLMQGRLRSCGNFCTAFRTKSIRTCAVEAALRKVHRFQRDLLWRVNLSTSSDWASHNLAAQTARAQAPVVSSSRRTNVRTDQNEKSSMCAPPEVEKGPGVSRSGWPGDDVYPFNVS